MKLPILIITVTLLCTAVQITHPGVAEKPVQVYSGVLFR
jgi:hypothetical protein